MANEGLWFLGETPKDNYDLIEEAQEREVFKEERERFAEEKLKWKDARVSAKKNQDKEMYKDFQGRNEIRQEYQPYINAKILEHELWISDNEEGIRNGETYSEMMRRQQEIQNDIKHLKNRSTDFDSSTESRRKSTDLANWNNNSDNTGLLLDENEDLFLEDLRNGKINIVDYPVDLNSVMGDIIPQSSSRQMVEDFEKNNQFIHKINTGTEIKSTYDPEAIDALQINLAHHLQWNEAIKDSGYLEDYKDVSSQKQFFKETQGKPNVSHEALKSLDGYDEESFDSELSKEYSEWLAEYMIRQRKLRERSGRTYVEKDETSTDVVLSEEEINIFNSPSNNVQETNGIAWKGDYQDVPASKITIGITRESILEGQDFGTHEDGSPIKWTDISEAVGGGENPKVQVEIYQLTQTESGIPVALATMISGGAEFKVIIPLKNILSVEKKFTNKTSKGRKLFELARRLEKQKEDSVYEQAEGDDKNSFDGIGDVSVSDNESEPDAMEITSYPEGTLEMSVFNNPVKDGIATLGNGKKVEVTPLTLEEQNEILSFGVEKISYWNNQAGAKPKYYSQSKTLKIQPTWSMSSIRAFLKKELK